jgi:hypothetical protein
MIKPSNFHSRKSRRQAGCALWPDQATSTRNRCGRHLFHDSKQRGYTGSFSNLAMSVDHKIWILRKA